MKCLSSRIQKLDQRLMPSPERLASSRHIFAITESGRWRRAQIRSENLPVEAPPQHGMELDRGHSEPRVETCVAPSPCRKVPSDPGGNGPCITEQKRASDLERNSQGDGFTSIETGWWICRENGGHPGESQ
jgi:hypothetical protein